MLYMTNDLLIYGENSCAFPHILEALPHIRLYTRSQLNYLVYEESFVYFLISVEHYLKGKFRDTFLRAVLLAWAWRCLNKNCY
jgi:hypothetical protein